MVQHCTGLFDQTSLQYLFFSLSPFCSFSLVLILMPSGVQTNHIGCHAGGARVRKHSYTNLYDRFLCTKFIHLTSSWPLSCKRRLPKILRSGTLLRTTWLQTNFLPTWLAITFLSPHHQQCRNEYAHSGTVPKQALFSVCHWNSYGQISSVGYLWAPSSRLLNHFI